MQVINSGLRPETGIGQKLLAETPLYEVGRVAEQLLSLDRLDSLYLQACRNGAFFSNVLERLNLHYYCAEQDAARIPAEGPVVVVSNHPFGFAEIPVLADLVGRRRNDFRFLANSVLDRIDVLRDYLIPVNPFGGPGAARSNLRGLRLAIEWLRKGGSLIVFPSGEVSSVRFPQLRVADPEWKDTISRVVLTTGATVVPAYVHGANSVKFQIAGLIHPRLRTALLPREFLDKRGHTIFLSVGAPVVPLKSSRFSSRQLTAYLRMRTELLETRRLPVRAPRKILRLKAIAQQGDAWPIRKEVESLAPLASSGALRVLIGDARDIPNTLLEIGRLREVSFRAAGEGTGRARDLDRFDDWYKHLFVWNAEREEIVGAYRIAPADEILAKRGPRGLYTSTLFRFEPKFLAKLGPALELGRSFIRPEYQRDYAPLLMLWKGIGRFAVGHPRYTTLFGPVSISNDYRAISRALIVEFCKAHRGPDLGGTVQPKHRFHARPIPGCDLGSLVEDIAELSELIEDLEPDKKGVPVLLRQYLKMGGKILDFNLDPQFSNAVDGLIVVDLLKADRRLLARYMGREGLASFYAHHSAPGVV
jgi:putative hemolysin